MKVKKYRKKPVVIEAYRWFSGGDKIVASFTAESVKDPMSVCKQCDHLKIDHGMCHTLEGYHVVCPGDWIITGVKGEHYPCKPDIFEMTYDVVDG